MLKLTYSLTCVSLKKKFSSFFWKPSQLKSRRHLVNFVPGCCLVFDPRRLAKNQNLLVNHGDNEMGKLVSHYEKGYTDIFKGEALHQSEDLVTEKVLAVWASFKEIMFECCCLFESSVGKKIANRSKFDKPIDKTMEGVPAAFFNDVLITISFAKIFIQGACIC